MENVASRNKNTMIWVAGRFIFYFGSSFAFKVLTELSNYSDHKIQSWNDLFNVAAGVVSGLIIIFGSEHPVKGFLGRPSVNQLDYNKINET